MPSSSRRSSAQSTAARTSEASAPWQPSRAPKTFRATIEACGAIPWAPAATPATEVPCPSQS